MIRSQMRRLYAISPLRRHSGDTAVEHESETMFPALACHSYPTQGPEGRLDCTFPSTGHLRSSDESVQTERQDGDLDTTKD